MHKIHCVKGLLEVSLSSSSVVGFLETFDGDRNEEVADSQAFLAEFIIDESSVCECVEGYVLMLLTEFEDVLLSDERLSAGKEICSDTQFFALGDDGIQFLI